MGRITNEEIDGKVSQGYPDIQTKCKISRLSVKYIYIKSEEDITMQKYVCEFCGYEYDPEIGDPDSGIAPGTAFEDIPDDWKCPVCGVGKENFQPA